MTMKETGSNEVATTMMDTGSNEVVTTRELQSVGAMTTMKPVGNEVVTMRLQGDNEAT